MSSLGGIPLCDDDHRWGAAFRLTEPLAQDLRCQVQEDGSDRMVAEVTGLADLPHLVVRLCVPPAEDGYRGTRRACLHAAQKALDLIAVLSTRHLQLCSLRGEEEHLVWYTDKAGTVLQATSTMFVGDEMVEPLHRLGEKALEAVPKEAMAVRRLAPAWHPSFRFFRAAQRSEDLANSFRSIYLALESVLDSVEPKAGSGLGETDWLESALKKVMKTSPLASRFADSSRGISAESYIMSIYKGMRLPTFHSKSSMDVRLPFLEDDEEYAELEQAFADLSDLYLDLARQHLGLDRATGPMIFSAGWRMLTRFMLGATDIHLTDDPVSAEVRLHDTEPNPRGARTEKLVTRNDAKREGPFERRFIGRVKPEELEMPFDVHGWYLTVDDDPFAFGTFDGPLDLAGVDHFRMAVAVRYRRSDRRSSFLS